MLENQKKYNIEYQKERQKICLKSDKGYVKRNRNIRRLLERMLEDMPERMLNIISKDI